MADKTVVLPAGWWGRVKKEAQKRGATAMVVSPYLTKGAVRELAEALLERIRLRVLTRFAQSDFEFGATSLAAIDYCMEHKIEVRALADLHAKMVVITRMGRPVALVGSGNLTDRGRSENREIMVHLEGEAASRARGIAEGW